MTELTQLLKRPVSFHRAFVDITGSINASLMLSQALYWSDRTTDAQGWFYKTAAEWKEELGLTRREQETARRYLLKCGFWHEDLRGVPAKCYFMVDKTALIRSFDKGDILQSDCPKSDTQMSLNGGTVMAESANLSIKHTETTTETTKTKPKSKEEREKEFGLLLAPFVEKYGKEMIREFFDYWTEWDDEGKLMAWEIAKKKGRKKTFQISKRLIYWKTNNKKFQKPDQVQQTLIPERASMPETYHQLR